MPECWPRKMYVLFKSNYLLSLLLIFNALTMLQFSRSFFTSVFMAAYPISRFLTGSVGFQLYNRVLNLLVLHSLFAASMRLRGICRLI